MYKILEPATWSANLSDGRTLTSKTIKAFYDIDKTTRADIIALRLHLKGSKYTITRKIKVSKNGETVPGLAQGFFYHIKAGRQGLMGPRMPKIPFDSERIGFCYNEDGDALSIELDNQKFVEQVHHRGNIIDSMYSLKKILKTKDDHKQIEGLIDKLVVHPFKFSTGVEFAEENIFDKRIGYDHFSLDGQKCTPIKDEFTGQVIGGTVTGIDGQGYPPRLTQNNEEITLGTN